MTNQIQKNLAQRLFANDDEWYAKLTHNLLGIVLEHKDDGCRHCKSLYEQMVSETEDIDNS